jgi:hypothetical protein
MAQNIPAHKETNRNCSSHLQTSVDFVIRSLRFVAYSQSENS